MRKARVKARTSSEIQILIFTARSYLWPEEDARYYGSTANVGGDTNIHIQPGGAVQKKMYGGGYAYNFHAGNDYGGTTSKANVEGTCRITIDSDIAQDPDRYDGDFVDWGGYATIGANSTSAVAESFCDCGRGCGCNQSKWQCFEQYRKRKHRPLHCGRRRYRWKALCKSCPG